MNKQLDMIEQAQGTFIDLAIKFGPKVVVAVAILVLGFYAGRWVGRLVDRSLGRFHLEPPVRILLIRVARLLVFGLFVVMALQNLGVDLLPLIAGLGVAGAGIALAMQGVLGNLAAGLTIIFTRPFRVGEYVSMIGVEGRVEAIELFTTTLSHADASRVVVPNRKIVGEILHNYGQIRQLDLKVPIRRAEDIDRALAAVDAVVKSNSRTLKDPKPVIGISSLADTSIVIGVAPWVNVDDFGPAGAEINRAIVDRFRELGVSYPALVQEIRLAGTA
jgi:small conductance mechanosensitive channel